MAYLAPAIGLSGLSIPSYSDIVADLIAAFQLIYGQNVYLAPDSADYQWISAVALKLSDTMQAVQLAYNARGPLTAIGADLDGVVKLNGLARKIASYSTALVTITGAVGATILSGVMEDANGILWDLPATVTIPVGGSIAVLVTAENPGQVNAGPGTISTIWTPTAGWTSGTNPLAAVAGTPIETDSQLRARQSLSVALPSHTMLAGTVAGIAAVSGVTRYNVLENPTGSTDSYGNPPHSITAVVEGGADLAVATAIYNNRGIGCLTNGTTAIAVTDSITGYVLTISFTRPTYYIPYVSISVHPLAGYTTATATAIVAAIVAYLNSLQIGQSVIISELYGAALSARPNPDAPLFSIRAVTAGATASPSATTDLALTFAQVALGQTARVVLTSV